MRKEWHNIFKSDERKNQQSRILYKVRLSFRVDGELKSFINKQKIKEVSTTLTKHGQWASLCKKKEFET